MISANSDLQVPYVSNSFAPGELGEVKAINGNLMVYNGGWQNISVYTSVHTDYEINEILDWAKNKIKQEAEEQKLAENFPAFAKAKQNYEMFKRLIENEVA